MLNISRFHYSKARALSCVLPTFGPLGGGGSRPPPLKTALASSLKNFKKIWGGQL